MAHGTRRKPAKKKRITVGGWYHRFLVVKSLSVALFIFSCSDAPGLMDRERGSHILFAQQQFNAVSSNTVGSREEIYGWENHK